MTASEHNADPARHTQDLTASDARPPSDTGTTDRCGCELPFHYSDIPVQCGCGRWYAVVVFHDYERNHHWRGWDVMPNPEADA